MKSFILLLSLLMAVLNITVPSSFSDLHVAEADSVSLNEFVEEANETSPGEEEEESSEKEEVEKEFYITAGPANYVDYTDFRIFSTLPVFISSYTASFLIPPLA